MGQPVTLQIALTPSDYACAVHVVPHQLRQLGSQVSEILLTVDTNGANLLPERKDAAAFSRLMDWIETLKPAYPHLRVAEADYRPETMRRVSQLYFGRDNMPTRTYRGAFYAYFVGLDTASSDHVFHLDSDMFVGGGSQTWVREATAWLDEHPDVFACNPFPGPPRPDLTLKTQTADRLPAPRGAYRFQTLSTRVYFVDRRRISHSPHKLRLHRTNPRQQIRAWLEGISPMALPEDLFTDYLRVQGLHRVDFLGEKPGLWAVHPPFRNEEFFEKLPGLVEAVENGAMPTEQLGDYDLNDSMVDWSSSREAIRRNRWWKRYYGKLLGR